MKNMYSIYANPYKTVTFRRVRKIANSVYYLRPYVSVCPHGTTRLPPDGISRNDHFSKKCRENSSFDKINDIYNQLDATITAY